jgi:thymidylate synthase ThyX
MNSKVTSEIEKVLYETEVTETKFYSIKDMKVEMLDWPINPYKTMVNMAMKTWGQTSDKWHLLSPEARFEVTKLILRKKALPLALEHPTFSFSVDKISRAAFDQIARARIGIVYASKGQKDDNLHNVGFIIPTEILLDESANISVRDITLRSKDIYNVLVSSGTPNWAARCILPMYTEHSFIFSANFMAIQNLLAKRLETTEMEDVVAFALLVREAIKIEFPLFAEYLRPSCDFIKKDMTAVYNGFSDIVSVPHMSDYRHLGYDIVKYPPKWKQPCTSMSTVSSLLNVSLPKPDEWKDDMKWEEVSDVDRKRFKTN